MDDPLEVVQRFAEAYRTADWLTVRDLQAEDAVVVLPGDHPEAGVYEGHDAIRAYFRRWLGTWERYEWTPERFVPEGERVAVLATERGRGKGSGAEIENTPGMIFVVRGAEIVRTEIYLTWDEALAALRS